MGKRKGKREWEGERKKKGRGRGEKETRDTSSSQGLGGVEKGEGTGQHHYLFHKGIYKLFTSPFLHSALEAHQLPKWHCSGPARQLRNVKGRTAREPLAPREVASLLAPTFGPPGSAPPLLPHFWATPALLLPVLTFRPMMWLLCAASRSIGLLGGPAPLRAPTRLHHPRVARTHARLARVPAAAPHTHTYTHGGWLSSASLHLLRYF